MYYEKILKLREYLEGSELGVPVAQAIDLLEEKAMTGLVEFDPMIIMSCYAINGVSEQCGFGPIFDQLEDLESPEFYSEFLSDIRVQITGGSGYGI